MGVTGPADTGSVDDSFNFGSRARRSPRGPRPSPATIAVALVVGAVAIAAVVGVLAVMKGGGEAVAEAQSSVVAQVDVARDAEAQVTLTRASTAAASLLAQDGVDASGAVSYAVAGPEGLAAFEPSVTYTADASTGPGVVSVAATDDGWSAAVRSVSGACWWIRLDGDGVQTFGSGEPCTGASAAAAAAVAW